MNEIFAKLNQIGAETKDALERFMNDEEMYLKYVRNFPDEPTMAALVKAVADKNYDAAEKAVHALKGIVTSLGFVPLADATIDMLEELRDGNTKAALDAYEDVKKQYQRFCDVINDWRRQP